MMWLETDDGCFINLDRCEVIGIGGGDDGHTHPYCIRVSFGNNVAIKSFKDHHSRNRIWDELLLRLDAIRISDLDERYMRARKSLERFGVYCG